ncbi:MULTISPECIES: glutaminase [Microbacterium]|uniref:Glutaminase n=1 Tax=Microbacterium wangchenii TaxID=2541726 RepID=A0ABX5SP91_9MICO|nr:MULTISPECIES: glutaminase [Microbacterium]MCK6068356.1 glutaminase [Microbacterium sp. EYE_512]QBR87632.1 glutaminase [Microbacterium wangchenii]TFV84287.1 glutaminase [Microbacterium sp. dk485]TXK15900.1 glutaminase [Microbacterium wangchenii]
MSAQPGAGDGIEDLLARARNRLDGAPRERLGELRRPRRILGIPRSPRIVPAGAAWHLGVLLLTEDAVLATGDVVRARTEAVRGYTAESQRARAGLAHAASRGGFADGETVHVGWTRLEPAELAAGTVPLAVQEGVPVVRWSAAGGYMPLSRYLDERIGLLLSPPERA